MHHNLQSQPVPHEWLINLDRAANQPRGQSDGKPHADLLNLSGVRSDPDKGRETKWIIKVVAEQVEIPTYPDCDCPIKEVKPHSPFMMGAISDVPWGGKRVIFSLRRRRWKCKSCGRTTTQPVDFLAEGRYHMTQRLLEYLQVHSLFETEHSLYKETGVFVRTIREIREEFVERLKKEVEFDTPYALGLDGVRADSRRRRVIITDITRGFVLEFMETGNKESISDRLSRFPGCEDIQIVTIDMCKTLCAAVKEALPQAIIIIDLFHIMRIANQVMDAVRNRLYPRVKKKREPGMQRPRPEVFRRRRASLTEHDLEYMEHWFNQTPELRLAYELKENVLEIFDDKFYEAGLRVRSKAAARHFYEEWLSEFPAEAKYPELHKDFKKLFSAMKNWGEFIFNYFDYKYTNAFTESMNRKVKDILRNSRGCKFETMRARIIYGTYLMKKRDVDREAEMKDLFPHSRRKRRNQQPTPKARSTRDTNGDLGGRSDQYEIPEVIQLALNFTN